VIRAERGLPFPSSRGALRRLEIPYGYFERRVRLPEVRLAMGAHELVDGCLTLHLRKMAPGETP
jgi:HSP20 family molecular chaperone IbpA